MESYYNRHVSEELAKQLLNMGFSLFKYGVNNYDGKPSFFMVDENNPVWETCKRYRLPTYAEVLDMLLNKGFIISITPVEYSEHLEYKFEIYQCDGVNYRLILSGTSGNINKTFDKALQDAIKIVLIFSKDNKLFSKN